jgi:hypothetical protein
MQQLPALLTYIKQHGVAGVLLHTQANDVGMLNSVV